MQDFFCFVCELVLSSLAYDERTCVYFRGVKCDLMTRCIECDSWSNECMKCCLKHKRILESKAESKANLGMNEVLQIWSGV